ncbi:MAG: hypothetical protein AB7F86_11000 [Bdellovibrionales bacterium]
MKLTRTLVTWFLLVGLFSLGLPACMINDLPACEVKNPDGQYDDSCSKSSGTSFNIEYKTADGHRPDGRFNFPLAPGVGSTEADLQAKNAIQAKFDFSPQYLQSELDEIAYYRGNICGEGYRLLASLGDIKVLKVRRTNTSHFDYELLLTCSP